MIQKSSAISNDEPLNPRRWIALIGIALASFAGAWDGAAPVVALPDIMNHFGVGVDSAVWVLTVGVVFFAVPMAAAGKLADLIGHKRLYLISVVAFIFFTFMVAVAPSFLWLLVFRALQGISSAPAFTIILSFITSSFPGSERGRAMGIHGMIASLAWAAGPPLGGLLVQSFGWRAVIAVEIPISLIALLVAWKLMPPDEERTREEFDIVGAATLTAAVLLFMIGLRWVGNNELGTWPIRLLAISVIGLLVTFIITERRHKSPFVPFTLFSNRYYSATTVFSLIQMGINFAIILLISLFLQEVTGLGAAQTGLIIGGLSLARFIFDPIAGRVAELYGVRRPSLIGVVILTGVGVFFAIGLTTNTPHSLIFAALFLSGVGLSLGRTPANTAISHLVPAGYLGIGLGVFSMCTFVGGALGQTVFGTLLRNVSGAGSGSLNAVPALDLSHAFTVNFITLAGLMVVAGIFGLRMPKRKDMKLL